MSLVIPESDICEPDSPESMRLVRWTAWLDENGEGAHGFDVYPSPDWVREWDPRCPDGNPQLVRRALGFRERSVRELELRVELRGDERGVCQTVIEEHAQEIYVRVLVCRDGRRSKHESREYTDCPVRVWLDEPLGERAVIDVDSDEELPLFIPSYLNDLPQPNHGYHPVNRRRSARE